MGVPGYATMQLPDAVIHVFKEDTGYRVRVIHSDGASVADIHCSSIKDMSDTIAVNFVTHRLGG